MKQYVVPAVDRRLIVVAPSKEALVAPLVARQQLPSGHWVVPYDVESVRVLRANGVTIRSPVQHYYDWNGLTPFSVQKATVDLLVQERRAFVLSSMGVGKTRTPIWAFDYLRRENLAGRMLVVAPLSILRNVWARELLLVCPKLRVVVVHGTAERRKKILASPHDVAIINFDGIKVCQEQLLAQKYDVVTVDEASAYRNARSARHRALQPLIRQARYAWALSGSPTPRAPSDAHGLLKLLKPEHPMAKAFVHFRDAVETKVSNFKWVPKADAAETVKKLLSPAVRFVLSDVMELPQTVVVDRKADLSAKQDELYRRLVATCRDNINNITAVNAGVLMNKLLQVSSGMVYDNARNPIWLDPDDRIAQLLSFLEEGDRHAIVFCGYRALIPPIVAALKGMDCTPEVDVIHGGIPASQRDPIFNAFQAPLEAYGQRRFLVAQPSAMAHGLTLTNADRILWFTAEQDLEVYEQANARITRPGQTEKTYIGRIVSTKAEIATYRRNNTKQSVQDMLLNLVADNTEGW